MRKANGIAAVVLTVIMLGAITGVAAATSISVNPDPITVTTGATGTQYVTVEAPGNVTSLTITGEGFDLASKFTVKIDGEETTSVSGDWSQPKTFTVTFTNDKGAPNANYVINYAATYISGSITKKAIIQADLITIPEFTTIAIPVAAIIGLLFFFNHRKHRKA